jgi:hypothetical protein
VNLAILLPKPTTGGSDMTILLTRIDVPELTARGAAEADEGK